MTPSDIWKHVRVDPQALERNPYLHPAPTGGGSGSGAGAGSGAGNPPPRAINASDYLKLENIVCTDADNNVFESYSELYLAKDIIRNPDKSQINKKLYDWAVYFEPQGLFLPSFALSCNLLQALFQQRSNPEIKAILDQYKDKGNGTGYQAQNTVVDFGAEQIIHYPTVAYFNQTGVVNAGKPRVPQNFARAALQDSLLEDALREAEPTRYVKQLTGLRDPSILVEMGTYFGKPAKLWFPWNGKAGTGFREKQAAWLGCSDTYFDLYASNSLDSNDAARGVGLVLPRSGAP